jgi:hypothetical protein
MVGGRAILAAILSIALAACGAAALPSSQAVEAPTDAPGAVNTPAGASPTETAIPPAESPSPTQASPDGVPPKPTGVTFKTDVVELPGSSGTDEVSYQVTYTVGWNAPQTEGVEIRVYGVTKCLSKPKNPKPGTSGPCLVKHTLLPSSVRVLTDTAPADAGEVSWITPTYSECGGSPVGPEGLEYRAIVLAAYNSAGNSIFAIADPGGWSRSGADEVLC